MIKGSLVLSIPTVKHFWWKKVPFCAKKMAVLGINRGLNSGDAQE